MCLMTLMTFGRNGGECHWFVVIETCDICLFWEVNGSSCFEAGFDQFEGTSFESSPHAPPLASLLPLLTALPPASPCCRCPRGCFNDLGRDRVLHGQLMYYIMLQKFVGVHYLTKSLHKKKKKEL